MMPRGPERHPGPGFEDVVVDRFVDEADLSGVHLEILVDLGSQAVGVDDDRVGVANRALIVQAAVGPRSEAERFRNRERVHGLHVDDE